MRKSFILILVLALVLTSISVVFAQEMTDVGTPRNETLIFQTFDRQTANPDQANPLMNYAVWRGFRELGWGYLWETDTGTGESYPELAAEMPIVLNDEVTHFRIVLKEGIYWSDGVEFTADDVIYTLETYFNHRDQLQRVSRIVNYIEEGSWEKIDDYTVEVRTVNPAYDFHTVMGVYTWSSAFVPVPKHIFEQYEPNIHEFRNTNPVTLGPYVVKEFDPSGFWQLWELREDWERSAWAFLDQDGYMPQYVLYKDYGPEETRSLSFVNNEYDVDTFMSPDSIKAAQARNEKITTFSDFMPYHNMDDACSYGLLMNLQKPPYDMLEVRWALALSLDLQSVGINSLSGEFIASPLPMVDQQILHDTYFEPMIPWLEELTLPDGYKPYNGNFGADLAATLESIGAQGIPEDTTAFGIGWWNYDVDEAGSLLESVGFAKNADGNWLLPSGEEWTVQLTIPGDWNKVMQRIGFSVADTWRTAGIQVNTVQVDNAEHGTVERTNDLREVQLQWTNCIFNRNYLNSYQEFQPGHIHAADSQETNNGNRFQYDSQEVYDLVAQAIQTEQETEEFYEIGREIMQHFVQDMAYLNLMGIPTTIPTNEYYWDNFPKADNYYAVPYSWWSSAKEMVANVVPTGN